MGKDLRKKCQKLKISAEEIIKEFLPFIKYMAFRFSRILPPHLTSDDLISVGLIATTDARDRFEPDKVKFRTYTQLRIKGAMIDEIRGAARIPRSTHDKIKHITNAKTALFMKLERMPDDTEVARSIKMPLSEFYGILKYTRVIYPIRLDQKMGDHPSDLDIKEVLSDPSTKTPLQSLHDEESGYRFTKLINILPENEKTVLTLYYKGDLTFKEIGEAMKYTEQNVWRIHKEAIIKLKKKLKMVGHKRNGRGKNTKKYKTVSAKTRKNLRGGVPVIPERPSIYNII